MSDQRHVLEVIDDDLWAKRASEVMAAAITDAVQKRGRCLMALSGGSSPWTVFDDLAAADLPWGDVTIFQVDERLVPPTDEARNLAGQQQRLAETGARWIPLPVDRLLTDSPGSEPTTVDIGEVQRDFEAIITAEAGNPPVLDLVHLGLGSDGHTASLLPGDAAVGELRRYVALTEPYHSGSTTPGALALRRLTLTRPVLDRARMVLWLISGAAKGPMLGRLLNGDMSIPAGLVHPPHSVVLADRSAAKSVYDTDSDSTPTDSSDR